jgi:hypothetical protein
MKLHETQLKFDSGSRDFPSESLSPILQSFWAVNQDRLEIHASRPTSVHYPAITQITPDHISEFLSASPGWSLLRDGRWSFDNFPFSTDSLVHICNTYLSDGRPWFFCEIDALRFTYTKLASEISLLNERFAYVRSRIERKLRKFEYYNTIQIMDDLKGSEITEIPVFEIPSALSHALGVLLERTKSIFRMRSAPFEIGPINEWIESRSEALVAQMRMPFGQRSAFTWTTSILQARLGQTEEPLEPFSIAELLFSDSNGEIAPMPFASCAVELPDGSQDAFVRGSLKTFVARQLLGAGYVSASDPVLDVLSDVMENEVRKLARTAATVRQGTGENPVDCFLHALQLGGFDCE